jgi:hypothetical protein
MVQDFADRFQALACHAPGVTGQQRTELFVGGLPDHIRVDVELQAPHDLQTAMHYARAYERRSQALQPPSPSRGARPPARPPPAAAPTTRPAPPALAATQRTFRRLTPAEQLERRRLSLCFNCDEPYAPGHVCPRLFYLETVDEATRTRASTQRRRPLSTPRRPRRAWSRSTRWRASATSRLCSCW